MLDWFTYHVAAKASNLMTITCVEVAHVQLKQHMVRLHVGVVKWHGPQKHMIYGTHGPYQVPRMLSHVPNTAKTLASHYDA